MVLKPFILPLALLLATFVLLMLPPQGLGELSDFGFIHADKFVHAILFMALTLSFIVAFRKQPLGRHRQKAIPASVIICISYGAISELAQGYADLGRTAEVTDFLANTAGCLVGIVAFKLIYGKEWQYR